MTLETVTLILLIAGLIPWHISKQIVGRRPNRRTRWQVYAIYWRLTVERPQDRRRGRTTWRLTVPLIRRLANAVWTAVRQMVA